MSVDVSRILSSSANLTSRLPSLRHPTSPREKQHGLRARRPLQYRIHPTTSMVTTSLRQTVHLTPVLRRAPILICSSRPPIGTHRCASGRQEATPRRRQRGQHCGPTGFFDNVADTMLNAFSKVHKPDKRFIEVTETSQQARRRSLSRGKDHLPRSPQGRRPGNGLRRPR